MTTKLTVVALVALSVAKLETELATGAYDAAELTEALALEQDKENPRSTAIEAIEVAMQPKEDPEPAPAPKGYKVAKGKSLTTRAGIKTAGDAITADMVSGGESKLELLKEKGFIS